MVAVRGSWELFVFFIALFGISKQACATSTRRFVCVCRKDNRDYKLHTTYSRFRVGGRL